MKKKLKWVVLAIVGLFIVAIVGVVVFLDSIVRSAVERGTSQSLALNTTLADADVGLLSGDVALGQLNIANPEGFTAPQMLSLGKVSLDTSYGKVFGTPSSVDALVVDKPKLVLEFKGSKSNLKTVADNLASSGGDQPTKPADPNAKPLKLIIDQLRVSGAQVEVISDIAALGTPYLIDIPTIEMTGIGNADGNRNGEEAGKIVSQIITRLTIEAQKSGKMPPQLAAILNGDLDAMIKNIGGRFEQQAGQLKAQAMQQVDAFKGQAQEKVGEVTGKAQEQVEKMKGELDQKLGGKLGDVLGGGKPAAEPKK
jgi:hypothetical protein